jgi:tetratricopeptide (TPR) repeat protein
MWHRNQQEIIAEFQTLSLQDNDRSRLYIVFDELNTVLGPKTAEAFVLDQFGHDHIADIKQAFADYYGDSRAHQLIDSVEAEWDSRRAIAILRRALQYGHLGIQARKAYQDLGMHYEQLRNTKRALHYYTQAIEIDGWNNEWLVFWRGRLYFQQSAWDAAKHDLERALELGVGSPDYEEAENYLGQIAHIHERSQTNKL